MIGAIFCDFSYIKVPPSYSVIHIQLLNTPGLSLPPLTIMTGKLALKCKCLDKREPEVGGGFLSGMLLLESDPYWVLSFIFHSKIKY